MRFLLLGPVEAWRDGRRLALGAPRRRALLALLLLHRDQVVPVERLLDALWPAGPPPSARQALQNHVSHLRRLLAPGAEGPSASPLLTRDPGYLIHAGSY